MTASKRHRTARTSIMVQTKRGGCARYRLPRINPIADPRARPRTRPTPPDTTSDSPAANPPLICGATDSQGVAWFTAVGKLGWVRIAWDAYLKSGTRTAVIRTAGRNKALPANRTTLRTPTTPVRRGTITSEKVWTEMAHPRSQPAAV